MTGLRWTDEMFQAHQRKLSKSPPQEPARSNPRSTVLPRGEPPGDAAHHLSFAQYRHAASHPLLAMCVAADLPRPNTEYRFHPQRKWAFDYCWPERLVAVECEGGIWRKGGGAHSHPSNIERDIEKYNAAALLGFRILRYAPEDLHRAVADLRVMFAGESNGTAD